MINVTPNPQHDTPVPNTQWPIHSVTVPSARLSGVTPITGVGLIHLATKVQCFPPSRDRARWASGRGASGRGLSSRRSQPPYLVGRRTPNQTDCCGSKRERGNGSLNQGISSGGGSQPDSRRSTSQFQTTPTLAHSMVAAVVSPPSLSSCRSPGSQLLLGPSGSNGTLV